MIKRSHNLSDVRLVAMDMDGVLTDGNIIMGAGGELCKAFHVHDGMGINLLRQGGIRVAVITGRVSEIAQRRSEELHIDDLCQGITNKGVVLRELAEKYNLKLEQVAYMGDDLNDLSALSMAGFACVPSNGVAEVKMAADYVTVLPGGRGAVRELAELILKSQGRWDELVWQYQTQTAEKTLNYQ